jgi:predicted carbohydrate-binding protein with CBM5 and CBM33 domain
MDDIHIFIMASNYLTKNNFNSNKGLHRAKNDMTAACQQETS